MKRLFITLFILAMLCSMAIPALAADYTFSSGPDSSTTFGKATSSDEPVSPNPMSENTRRNKDAAYLPPPYFVGSGNIPTDPSSLYFDNAPAGSGNSNNGGSSDGYISLPDVSGFLPPTSTLPATVINTAPKYYADGSIGTLYVARTGQTVKVYEGEQLDNLLLGAGHFSSTSAWDGNVALCGHNRGPHAFFDFIANMQVGDKITYTTLYGNRTYEVYSKTQISDTDYSGLGWSADNILTLITCIADQPALRYLVQARQVT